MHTQSFTYLEEFLKKKIELDEVKGSAIAIIHKGKEVYRNEFGMADVAKNMEMKRDTIFRCYSMTKPITNMAVMILLERGLISLSDPVENYLPGFKDQKVLKDGKLTPVETPVTIQNLLDMDGGVVYPDIYFDAGQKMQDRIDAYYDDAYSGKPLDTVAFANMVGEMPLEFHPTNGWRYSFSADVLGGIVEVVSGMRYSDFLKKNIFNPLGMTDTDFYVPEEKMDRFMEVYEWTEDGLKPWEFDRMLGLTYRFYKRPEFESGGAGLVSTIDDYEKIVRTFLGFGTCDGVRILGRKSIEYMSCDHLKNEAQRKMLDWESLRGYGYGNLMRQMLDPHGNESLGTVGEYGWDGFLGTYMFVDPKEDLGIVYVIQKCGGNGYRDVQVIRNIIYGALD
ncbi:MAG: beta-lactamase family protein [Lachnospiraceae bacterium]|nr:beta-lactamase family protein [Lachnospiraceae bacterium]